MIGGVPLFAWAVMAAVLAMVCLSPIPDGTITLFVDGFQESLPQWNLRATNHLSGYQRSLSLSSEFGTGDIERVGIRFENISIEYCPGCRWMTKAFWMATEILQRSSAGQVREVTVIPSEPGTFLITAKVNFGGESDHATMVQLWDRKIDGGFPPIDLIEFEKRVDACIGSAVDVEEVDVHTNDSTADQKYLQEGNLVSHVVIQYCREKGELLRAAYYGQELLTTFCEGELEAISLQPDWKNCRFGLRGHREIGEERPSVTHWVWNNSVEGKFPEVKELKRLIRDKVTPQKDLGHSEDKEKAISIVSEEEESAIATRDSKPDNKLVDDVGDCIPCNDGVVSDSDGSNEEQVENNGDDNDHDDEMDDDDEEDEDEDEDDDDAEAEEARRYFGVL